MLWEIFTLYEISVFIGFYRKRVSLTLPREPWSLKIFTYDANITFRTVIIITNPIKH